MSADRQDQPGTPLLRCVLCGCSSPRWRLIRHGDAAVTWSCTPHLADVAEDLQRPQDGAAGTRITLIPSTPEVTQ